MSIVKAPRQDAPAIAGIIRKSHKSVAEKFRLTLENCPTHPSLCQAEWVEKGMDRGEIYYLYLERGEMKGCVAFATPEPGIGYLNRLSVLPRHRRQGIGKALVDHVLSQARQHKLKEVTIGIIHAHTQLKDWYMKLGFQSVGTKDFNHLPFTVHYLSHDLGAGTGHTG